MTKNTADAVRILLRDWRDQSIPVSARGTMMNAARFLKESDKKRTPESEAAAILGRKGGKANSPAQQAQRAKPKPGAGRPRKQPKP